jgi:hypothetical protein
MGARGLAPTLMLAVAVMLAASAVAAATSYVPDEDPVTKKPIFTCIRSVPIADSRCGPRLEFEATGGFRPKTLPRRDLAPVAIGLDGKAFYSDGSAPPPLKELTISFDKHGTVDVTGLPACGRNRLATSSVRNARRICQESMVGTGAAHVALESRAQSRVRLPLSIFNGGVRDGATTLLIHSRLAGSATPIVVPVALEKAKGRYGLEAALKMPPVLDGAALLDFTFAIERFLGYEGTRRHFALARCFDGRLQGRLMFGFVDGSSGGGTVFLPCSAKG